MKQLPFQKGREYYRVRWYGEESIGLHVMPIRYIGSSKNGWHRFQVGPDEVEKYQGMDGIYVSTGEAIRHELWHCMKGIEIDSFGRGIRAGQKELESGGAIAAAYKHRIATFNLYLGRVQELASAWESCCGEHVD